MKSATTRTLPGYAWYVPWLFVLPALLVFTAIVVVPVGWSLSLSLFEWSGLGSLQFVGIGNYIRMVQDEIFVQAFWNTLFFSVVGTAVQVVAGLAMAMLLLSIEKFRNLLRVIYFVPCVISSVAISQIFVRLLSVQPEGVVNAFFGAVGLEHLQGAYLSDPRLTLTIVTLVDAYKFAAIYMVIYYAAFLSIDKDVLDAAMLDGANWWQQYVYIKFPLIKAVIAITLVMLVSGTLKGFDVAYIMTAGGPGASSELVSTYLYKTTFNASQFGYGSAIGTFLVIESLLIIVVLRRVLRQDSVGGDS